MSFTLSTIRRISDYSARAAGRALVVIDSDVGQVPALAADIESRAEVLLLSAEQDGIAQITEKLKEQPNLSSLHIVSHGTPGRLLLGSAQLSFENLDQYAEVLETWSDALEGKDILLYGCQIAKGALGHLFLQQLHQLTGANLAASSQRVGLSGEQYNWVLESSVGDIQNQVIFSQKLQQTYNGHFDPEVSISSDITTVVEDEGTEITLTIELSEAPGEAVLVNIDTGKPFALGDFDVFAPPPQASATGGQLVRGNQDNSGFTFAVLEQTATITLPVFDDPDRTENGAQTDPDGPLRNDDIGEEQTTFSVAEGDGYTIGGNSSVTVTLLDSNTPEPEPEPEPEPQAEPEPEPDTSQLAVAQSRRPAPMPARPDPPQRTAAQTGGAGRGKR